MATVETSQDAGGDEKFALTTSRHFPVWLAGQGASVAFSTYQAGKLHLLGVQPNGRLSVFERTFPRSMGLGVSSDGRSLALAMLNKIQRLDNVLQRGQVSPDNYDAVFAPHASWVTGDVDAHDVGFGENGRPIFVNTLFSCLAEVSDGYSFRPIWKPGFISRLAPEDRCHLNGMAVENGRARYVTAVSRSDAADGWRDHRQDGGIVIDVGNDAIICHGLSMPHSPRLHGDRLWLLNSGSGELGYVDPKAGRFEPIAFCPGYARGLAFVGGCAIVGLSLARENRTFSGLNLDQGLVSRNVEPRCGLAIFDLESGDMLHWVRIEGIVRELYDVAVLPDVVRPSAIGFKTDEINHIISIDE